MVEVTPTRLLSPCAEVVACVEDCRLTERGFAVVTDATQFHAQNFRWPDQPGDRGELIYAEQRIPIIDCVMGAYNEKGDLWLDSSIPVKVGEPGWIFVCLHILQSPIELNLGDTVRLQLNCDYQQQLSSAHTACHLASMALNRALMDYWRKDPGARDALGSIDFDRLAITSSRILPLQSRDDYRLGKSLRKKGFNSEQALTDLASLTQAINAQLMAWLQSGAEIHIEQQGASFLDSRYWHCEMEGESKATIPCGGTHLSSLGEIEWIRVDLASSKEGFSMVTTVQMASLRVY